MVAYKVVTKDRKSSNATFLGSKSKWVLDYKKGETVEAVEGSVGILAFENLEDAEGFKRFHPHSENLKIVGVEGHKPCEVWLLSAKITEHALATFYGCEEFDVLGAPSLGTITFESIKVLT